MNRILVSLHFALMITVILPVFKIPYQQDHALALPWRNHFEGMRSDCLPLEEAFDFLRDNRYSLMSVTVAGLPGFLALLNLPLLIRLRRSSGDRWRAYSSMVLGLLSTSLLVQLLARYGAGCLYGGWVIWGVSVLLTLAGTAAVARLKPATALLPAIRSS